MIALVAPSLERLWRATLAGTELVCNPKVPRDSVPVGERAVLLLKPGGATILDGATELGELDTGSIALLDAGLRDIGPVARTLTCISVRITRIGTFSNEFSVSLCGDPDEPA
ncbi:hypothetical protein [Sandaracinus amylolyticus]|uniref:hypothetical protein n=1 Tax=Sandaracinus amylolyticus TaxID=927083 RepID=UPI001F2B04C6|nr:hypothetical protein [Sandaracinus amylolyticus]